MSHMDRLRLRLSALRRLMRLVVPEAIYRELPREGRRPLKYQTVFLQELPD